MIWMSLRQNINKNLQKQHIHNQSYIILKKELSEKDNQIKKLKDYIKDLEYKNNSLSSTINKLEYQKSIDSLSISTRFKSKF